MVDHRDESARVAQLRAGIESHRLPDREDRREARGRLPARRNHATTSRASTPACFEPTIDYVVVKIPRWQFEKFPGAEPELGTQMKSVGEVMAIGRTFKEALGKGIRSLETGKAFGCRDVRSRALIAKQADHAHSGPARATSASPSRSGYTVEQVHEMTSHRSAGSSSRSTEVVDLEAVARKAHSRLTSPRSEFRKPSATVSAIAQLAEAMGCRADIDVRAAPQGTRRHTPSSTA